MLPNVLNKSIAIGLILTPFACRNINEPQGFRGKKFLNNALPLEICWDKNRARNFISQSFKKKSPIYMFSPSLTSLSFPTIPRDKLQEYLKTPDLTDPRHGVHAINLVLDQLYTTLKEIPTYSLPCLIREGVISNVQDEFDKLYIPSDHPQRSPYYVRYIDASTLLRSHTTPAVHKFMKEMSQKKLSEGLLFAPGLCFLRVEKSKQKTEKPHKVDIWNIYQNSDSSAVQALTELVGNIIRAFPILRDFRITSKQHPYTLNGISVEVISALPKAQWVKIMEGGQLLPDILKDSGLDPERYTAVGVGIGLDRLVMTVKGVEDIRLLRSKDPLVRRQMTHLDP